MELLALIFSLTAVSASVDIYDIGAIVPLVLLLSGFVFYEEIENRYRNEDKRHRHERETSTTITNLACTDLYLQHRKGLRDGWIIGANHERVDAASYLPRGSIHDSGSKYLKQ